MRIIGNDPSVPRQTQEVASGTLPNGKPVIVNADGTVSVVGVQSGAFSVSSSNFSPSTGLSDDPSIVFDPNDGSKFVFVYNDGANSNYGTAVIGTISGTSISFGTPVVFVSGYFASPKGCVGYSADGTKVVINVRNFSNSNYGSIIAASVSGTVLTFGSANTYQSNTTYSPTLSCDPFDSTKFVFTYRNSSGSTGEARVGTLSGTSVSYGTAVTFNNATTYNTVIKHNPNTQNKVMIVWNDNGQFSGTIGTVSGTSISFGSETTIASNAVSEIGLSFDPDSSSNKVVAVMADTTNAKGKAIVCSVSGSTITVGSTVEFFSSGYPSYMDVAFSGDTTNQFYVGYRTTVSPLYARAVVGTVSGTTCSFANDTQVSSGNSYYVVLATNSSGNILYGYRDNDSTTRNIIALCSDQAANLTSENYIGMSRGGVDVDSRPQALGSPSIYESAGVAEVGSAYDANAQKVVIAYRDAGNSNYGTAVVGTVSGTGISFGTPVVFESAVARYSAVAYDANAQKVVIAYKDVDNSNSSTAIVGTVSGTSISFGTPVVFDSNSSGDFAATYDTNAQKVVIAYMTANDNGIAIVGTVSGTSISFGSGTQLENSRNSELSIAYDSANQKVVVAYKDLENSNYGTAVVGTVSGTSISFGTPAVFNAATSTANSITYDSNSGKVVIAYYDGGNSNYGTAVVGTISGTSISFGSEVVFEASNTSNTSAIYDPSAQRIVIAYRANSVGNVIVGNVSGTSISFATSVQFESGAANSNTTIYDTNNSKVVISYQDGGNSDYGTAVVFQAAYENISRGEVADGGHALVDTQGAISDNQIGLTPAQSYFVQNDGTLSTTAADPSVFAGTAVSATKLIVKG